MSKVKSLINFVSLDTWVIKTSENKYYQFRNFNFDTNTIFLKRNDIIKPINISDFNNLFRLANANEIKQHEEFLASKTNKTEIQKLEMDLNKCEFYMLTVNGENGSKVRHTSFSVATTEATRLAKKMSQKVYILGVVATVEVEVKTKLVQK